MKDIPKITLNTALFLDFDGTLVKFYDHPNDVIVPSSLVSVLGDLQVLLKGALAIISGRQIDVLDQFLTPLQLPSAGEHGLQLRNANGWLLEQTYFDSGFVLQACNSLADQHPALFVEQKRAAVALHYRRAPELETLCRETLGCVLEGHPQLKLLQGKLVVEAVPAHVNKGDAIATFLREPPFYGRISVFVGDDTTDETGFSTVQAYGGSAIKVGPGPTLARHRLASVQAVCEWLMETRNLLAGTPCKKVCR